MSATQETTGRQATRKQAAHDVASANGANGASNGQSNSNTVTIEIAELQVTLPLKFNAGMALTENQAKILDAAYQRQFTNNQNAMAKARAEKLAKASTEAERAAAQPLTATQLAELYATYEPNVGGSRMGSMEKTRNDAAWRMWTALVAEHNANVRENGTGPGYVPVIAKAGKAIVPGLSSIRDNNGKVVEGGTVAEQRDRLIARILTMPEYADKVQFHVDAILAERKGSKDDAGTSEEKISVASLFD
jgi:hypothetical protein